ncbi:hypothetical protein AVEN_135175-1 [Araneus ventricosus]|uniref:Uncharacterized protein n=1 Tax=Araneus ventricosus TaxID=182803 RepID=A0A4Y2IU83_ARAVE|nr:hypothetical protein AVEN_135175-1 [Araneus ventricosus]
MAPTVQMDFKRGWICKVSTAPHLIFELDYRFDEERPNFPCRASARAIIDSAQQSDLSVTKKCSRRSTEVQTLLDLDLPNLERRYF